MAKIAGRMFGEAFGRLLGNTALEKLTGAEAKEAAKKLTEAIKKSMEDGNLALITRPSGILSRGNPSFVAVVTRVGCGKYEAVITVEDEPRGDTDGKQVVIKVSWEYRKDNVGIWQPVFSKMELSWEKREK